MRRRTALLLALLSCLAVPASAAAVPVPRAGVRLLDCDTGDRTADFEADMRAVSGAVRLQLRFTLQVLDDDVWTRVAAPNTDLWLTAAAGRTRYVYDKRVEKLQPGAYRAQVRFRWRDAAGATLRTSTHRSKACRVPDPRPDLVPVRIATSAGPSADTRTYALTVLDAGRSDAGPFQVSLAVSGMPLPEQWVGPLAAGRRVTATFVGPACPAGGMLVAGVDTSGVVDEAREADDWLSVPCDGG